MMIIREFKEDLWHKLIKKTLNAEFDVDVDSLMSNLDSGPSLEDAGPSALFLYYC